MITVTFSLWLLHADANVIPPKGVHLLAHHGLALGAMDMVLIAVRIGAAAFMVDAGASSVWDR